MRRSLLASLCLAALIAGAACDSKSESTKDAPSSTGVPSSTVATANQANPVVRDILETDIDPPGAPGRTMTLIRYTIAPGAQLPAHIHPGVQLASIQSGTLTYTVVSGTAEVKRGATASGESVTGPATTTLGPGDSVTETGDMVHYGANKTAAPVVILATLLTEDGRDLAITVPVTSTTTSVP
jgi:oxalate decarboxylase/phosphoglucose isomerase-like protein (cupin superfamily)